MDTTPEKLHQALDDFCNAPDFLTMPARIRLTARLLRDIMAGKHGRIKEKDIINAVDFLDLNVL